MPLKNGESWSRKRWKESTTKEDGGDHHLNPKDWREFF